MSAATSSGASASASAAAAKNPRPKVRCWDPADVSVYPWNAPADHHPGPLYDQGGLHTLGFLLACTIILAPLALVVWSINRSRQERAFLASVGYQEYGPDTTRYGRYVRNPVTRRYERA